MLFNSFEFLLFFPAVTIIYYLLPWLRMRNLFLLAASYYFYMNWEPSYALLLLTSTSVTYLAALGIDRWSQDKSRKRLCLWTSVAINLCILLFFKYYYFIGENVTTLLDLVGVQMQVPDMKILLPVGISFYTFQALGYSIDVYRGTLRAERDFFTYALFVSFFPQLVAGPIERSTNLLKQFYVKHTFDYDRGISGMKLMLWGYFLKIVVADRCAIYVDNVYNSINNHEGYSTLIASILFTFQLYGDFAGYTFIAIGAARIMGFFLMDNFKRPYLFSTSIQDYWRRNHISLTSWFMDYVYYPLTERKDTLNWWCCAIFITFIISGFWHGAAWTFVLWGTVHGLLLVIEMRSNKRRRRWEKKHHLAKNEWYIWSQRILVFAILVLTLVLFRANSLEDAFVAFRQIFSPHDFSLAQGRSTLIYMIIVLPILFIKELFEEYNIRLLKTERPSMLADVAHLTMLCTCIFLLGSFTAEEFIYFQF